MLIDFRKLFPRYNIKPKGVLHLGANIGEEAIVYNDLWIKTVTWVEANPEIFVKLKQNISKFSGQRAYNFCVGDEDKKTILHVADNGSQSSSVLELGTHKIQHPDVNYVKDIEVDMFRIDSFFNKSDILLGDADFLNCDLQGFELQAMRGMGDLLRQFKWIYSEVNKADVYKGCVHVNDLDLFLNGFGFKRVETAKWIGDWTDALYVHKSVMAL